MNENQAAALKRVWEMAQGDHGGSHVCAQLLLGLYNGDRFKFDLTELRRLDSAAWQDCMSVLAVDARPRYEVHQWLNLVYGVRDMGDRFELMACDWRMKGRCKKEWETEIRARMQARAS